MSKKREKSNRYKKGISPVVAVVLIISFVLVIAGIVFVFGTNALQKASEKSMGEKLCSEVEFSVGDFCQGKIEADGEDKANLVFNGVNEAGSSFDGFLISIDYGGNMLSVSTISTLPYSELETGEAKTLYTEVIENIHDIEKIKVTPRINNTKVNIVCDKNSETFNWDEVGECSTP